MKTFLIFQVSAGKLKTRLIDPCCPSNSRSLLLKKTPIPHNLLVYAGLGTREMSSRTAINFGTLAMVARARLLDQLASGDMVDNIMFEKPLNKLMFHDAPAKPRSTYIIPKKKVKKAPFFAKKKCAFYGLRNNFNTPCGEFLERPPEEADYRDLPECEEVTDNLVSTMMTSFVSFVLDIHRAFQILPVKFLHLNRFLIWDPIKKCYFGVERPVMAFGNIHSIVSWCRVTDAMKRCFRSILKVCFFVFVDDFSAMIDGSLVDRLKYSVAKFLYIAKLPFGEEKIDIGPQVELLGFLVRASKDNEVQLKITDRKIEKFLFFRDEIVAQAGLSIDVLSKIIGLCVFLFSCLPERNTVDIPLFLLRMEQAKLENKGILKETVVKGIPPTVEFALRLIEKIIIKQEWSSVETSVDEKRVRTVVLTDASWIKGEGGGISAVVVTIGEKGEPVFKVWNGYIKASRLEHLKLRYPINFLETMVPSLLIEHGVLDGTSDFVSFFNDNTTAETVLRGRAKLLWSKVMLADFSLKCSKRGIKTISKRVPTAINIADWGTKQDLWAALRAHDLLNFFDEINSFNEEIVDKFLDFSFIEEEVREAIRDLKLCALFEKSKTVGEDEEIQNSLIEPHEHLGDDESDDEDSEVIDARVLLRSLLRHEPFRKTTTAPKRLEVRVERMLFVEMTKDETVFAALKLMAKAKFNGLSISKILLDFEAECDSCVSFVNRIVDN